MPEAVISQRQLGRILGKSRVRRYVHGGWLVPAERTPRRVLYRVSDVRAVLQRLERGETPPPDRIEVQRVRDSEKRNGRAYVPHPRPPHVTPELDWGAVLKSF